ncbi:MAG: YbhB/YbcL family Raf kinase inhibitor-like protein [Candidatus Saccharimonadales bacterium]
MDSEISFQLKSAAFSNGSPIPEKYTCKDQNINPPLTISGVPDGTTSLALIMHDPDAPSGDYLHWTIWNLSPDLASINENKVPEGAVEGINDFGKVGYGGPCPPAGTHHYLFVLFALDTKLDVTRGAKREEVSEAITDHTITQTTLVGVFTSPASI